MRRAPGSRCRGARAGWSPSDLVVERFTARGAHRGELFGVPGSGREIVLHGINVFRITDDRIVERWGCVDRLGLLHGRGIVPG